MAVEIKVEIEQGAKRLVKLNSETDNLKALRGKIASWVGGDFCFLKEGYEIHPDEESDYQVKEFPSQDNKGFAISVKPTKQKDSPTKPELQAVINAAENTIKDPNLPPQKLEPTKPTDFQQSDLSIKNPIKDGSTAETDNDGTVFNLGWEKLSSLVEKLQVPEVLRVDKEGLTPVNYSVIQLKSPLSKNNVKNEAKFNDDYAAYESQWEQTAYKSGCKTVSGSLGIPIPKLSAMLGISGSYQTSFESQVEQKETSLYLVAERIVQKCKLIIKKEDIQVTDDFKDKVKKAVNATSDNVSKLRKLFQEYGYLVPTVYIIGGKIFAEETTTFSSLKEKSEKSRKFGAGFSAEIDKAGFKASASGGYNQTDQSQNSETNAQSSFSYKKQLKGGDEAKHSDGTAWLASLTYDRWQIVGYDDLVPITKFLDEELQQKCENLLETFPEPEIEVKYTSDFINQGNDSGSRANRSLTVYKPAVDSGWCWVGHYAEGNYSSSPSGKTIIIKPLKANSDAVKPPLSYEQVWANRGSRASKYFSCWRPIPPQGYKALGYLMRLGKDDYNPPSGEEIKGLVCVREDLVAKGHISNYSIWDDKGSGASKDCTLWKIKSVNDSNNFESQTFFGVDARSNNRPDYAEVYCLKKDPFLMKLPKEDMPKGDTLVAPASLKPGEYLRSANGKYSLIYQKDGNLVLYRNADDKALWSSGTYDTPAYECAMQDDGNFVVYTAPGNAVWSSETYGSERKNSKVILHDDGNLAIYDQNKNCFWKAEISNR